MPTNPTQLSPTAGLNLAGLGHSLLIWLAFTSHPIVDKVYFLLALVLLALYFLPLPARRANPYWGRGYLGLFATTTTIFVLYQYLPALISAFSLWGDLRKALPL